ncbi:hypothetical protein ACQKP5_03580 [Pseudomonas vancouverensis]|uniref:hypothetical protein n=1 Tax=Pseudomonas vancouverensis TaxID=95300 RepID=UPI003D04BE55
MSNPSFEVSSTGAVTRSTPVEQAASRKRVAAQIIGVGHGHDAIKRFRLDVSAPKPAGNGAGNLDGPSYCAGHLRPGDLIVDQTSLDRAWNSVKEHLETQPLAEHELFSALQSGFFQRPTGRALADLFVEATIGSVNPIGGLTTQRLGEIVDVICHLPPRCWADALGESLNFPASVSSDSVVGFIQAQLTSSREQRDVRISNGELLTDDQWQRLRDVVKSSREYISKTRETPRNSALSRLEDALYVRPSPEEARALLGVFLKCLDASQLNEIFPDSISNEVRGFWQTIEPKFPPPLLDEFKEATQSLVDGANAALNRLGSLTFGELGKVLEDGIRSAVDQTAAVISTMDLAFRGREQPASGLGKRSMENGQGTSGFSLLKTLEEIERKGDFYEFVVTDGPRAPKGIANWLVWTLNASHTLGSLKGPSMGSGLRVAQSTAPPYAHPSQQASKTSMSMTRMNMTVEQHSVPIAVVPEIVPFASGVREKSGLTGSEFGQFAAQADEVLQQMTRVLTGYRPVDAVEVLDPRPLMQAIKDTIDSVNVRTPMRDTPLSSFGAPGNSYADTVIDINNEPDLANDRFGFLQDRLSNWLQSTLNYLTAISMPSLSAITGVIQQHTRVSTAVAGSATLAIIYGVVNAFYNRWFVQGDSGIHPNSSSSVDNLQNPQVPSGMGVTRPEVPNRSKNNVSDAFVPEGYYAHLQISQVHSDSHEVEHNEPEDTPPNPERTDLSQEQLESIIDAPVAISPGDADLQMRVLAQMELGQNDLLSVPENSLMSEPLSIFHQTLNTPKFKTWLAAKGFVPSSLRIYEDRISGLVIRDGVTSTETFSLWDTSGYWQVAHEMNAARYLLDPGNCGLSYENESRKLPRNVILDFYRVVPPTSVQEAKALADKIRTEGWPELKAGDKLKLNDEIDNVRELIREANSRARLVQELSEIVEDKADEVQIFLSAEYSGSAVDSPLARNCSAIINQFNDFVLLPEMQSICEGQNIDCSSQIFRLKDNRIEFYNQNSQWDDLTVLVAGQPALIASFNSLLGLVKYTGNTLYTSMSFDLQQILSFGGFGTPGTAGEVRNVIQWLQTSLPQATSLGDFGAELLDTRSITALTSDDRTRIKNLSNQLFSDGRTIIDALGEDVLAGTSVKYRQKSADKLLSQILEKDQADAWGHEFLQTLNWYGAEGEAIPEHYKKLLLAAVKLTVDPEAAGKPGNIAGYNVYQPDNLGRNLNAIRAEIEAHLIENKGVTAQAAPLVAHIFLADVAPELLTQELPDEVTLGSTNWMLLRLGVAIAEANERGCSRILSVDQLTSLALLSPTNNDQQLLFKALAADILLIWANMNGVIQPRADFSYNATEYLSSAEGFANQRSELSLALRGFGNPLTTRRELAVEALAKAFSPYTKKPIEQIEIKFDHCDYVDGYRICNVIKKTLVEAYMDGDLSQAGWNTANIAMGAVKFDEIRRSLPDLNESLATSVAKFFGSRKRSFHAMTKALFANLPLDDRRSIELGNVQLFTLREETGMIKENETPANQEVFRGRQGTILRTEHNKIVKYFEVFPGRFFIVKRIDLNDPLPLNGEIKIEKTKVSKGGTVNSEVQRGTELPFDFSAYFSGSKPRPDTSSPHLIVEPLSFTLPAKAVSEDQNDFVPNTYFSERTSQIVSHIINDNFLVGGEELIFNIAKGQTTAEQNRAYWASVKEFLLQLIPFVGCVSDLSSGERMRFINGAFGCMTDLISVINTLVGGVAKVGGVLKSAVPASFKVFEALKITGTTLSSAINPIDGVPDVLAAGARVVRNFSKGLSNGMLTLTEASISHANTCLDRLRAFFGGAAAGSAKRLPRRAKILNVVGKINGTAVIATTDKGKWYAVDDYGNPMGRALSNFIVPTTTQAPEAITQLP